MREDMFGKVQIGRRNLSKLYIFAGTSRLWFDGGLWVLYLEHKGISLLEIGLLEALLHVVCLVTDVPIGIFADRSGWKLSLSLSCLAGVVYTATCLLTANIWWFALAFAARGLQVTLTNGCDAALAYESAVMAGIGHRYRAISGRLFAVGLVSLGMAEVVGGALVHLSWSAIYVAFTLANVVSLFVVLCIRESRSDHAHNHKNVGRVSALAIARDAVRFAGHEPDFLKWIAFSGVLSGFIATFAFYGQSLLLHAGWSVLGIGILTGVENGVGALTSVIADGVANRCGEDKTIMGIAVVGAAGLVLFAWLPGLWLGMGYLFGSMAGNMAEPLIDQGLNRMIPSRQRATLLSANSTAFSAFMMIGFPLYGILANEFGSVSVARFGSLLGVLCIGASTLFWLRNRDERELSARCERPDAGA